MTAFQIIAAYILLALVAGSLFGWIAYRMRDEDDRD